MEGVYCILDACSVVNLINIDDESDYLIKKLKNCNIFLCQKVFKEVNKSVYEKLEKRKNYEKISKELENNLRSDIEKKLTYFRRHQVFDETISHDLKPDIFHKVHELTGYHKENGEFFSTVLALYLSRESFIKVFFYTDDYPAHSEFSKFYFLQQIGYIEDTSDLLLLLYRIDENFKKRDLIKILSSLYSEYISQVKILSDKLNDCFGQLKPRDKKGKENLYFLISKFQKLDFTNIRAARDYFFNKGKKYKNICLLLEKYDSVFELETNRSQNLLIKIEKLKQDLGKTEIFKI